MTTALGIRRRTFLGGVAALGAIRGFGVGAQAVVSPSVANLPARGHVVIRDAYVITMEPGQADLPRGDVHVDNGVIVDIGTELAAPGAEVIDGRGFIVMPGLIDTHWHMWTTLLRNMSGDDRAHGYFPMTTALAKFHTPRDMYTGTMLSAAEALHSGTTTVHNWCHNIVSHEHAVEDLRAMQETGLRGRFSYGPARATPLTQPIDVGNLARMQGDWAGQSNEGLLTLGLAWRGVQVALPNADGKMEIIPLSPDMYRVEYEAARKLDLPVSVHLNSNKFDSGHILALQKLGYVFNGLQVIHAINSSPEEMDILAAGGASVSISPASELRIGFGLSKIGEFLDHKVNLALSVDSTPLTGNADMFGIMKLAQNLENGRSENEFKLPARRVLELATIEGAKALGLADRTGSLKKGKRADIIMVATGGINIGPFTEPAYMLVDSAQASNVDTVLVDGRILKRSGKLTAIDAGTLVAEATAASVGVRQRSNWK
jgi:5-methylthioadenosine/S-adenosylhomocysteine deaminase